MDSALWSSLPKRKTVTLEWTSWEGAPGVDHRELAGLEVLWLLRRDPKAVNEVVYRADDPTRTIDLHVPGGEVREGRTVPSSDPGPRVRSILGVLETAATKR